MQLLDNNDKYLLCECRQTRNHLTGYLINKSEMLKFHFLLGLYTKVRGTFKGRVKVARTRSEGSEKIFFSLKGLTHHSV
jgi:hypothetical protein